MMNFVVCTLHAVRVIKFRILRRAGYTARMNEVRTAFRILTDKHTGKRSLGRPRRRWEDSVEWILK